MNKALKLLVFKLFFVYFHIPEVSRCEFPPIPPYGYQNPYWGQDGNPPVPGLGLDYEVPLLLPSTPQHLHNHFHVENYFDRGHPSQHREPHLRDPQHRESHHRDPKHREPQHQDLHHGDSHHQDPHLLESHLRDRNPHHRDPHHRDPHLLEPHLRDRNPHHRDPHHRDPHLLEPHLRDRNPHHRNPHPRDPHHAVPHLRNPHHRGPHHRSPHSEDSCTDPHGRHGICKEYSACGELYWILLRSNALNHRKYKCVISSLWGDPAPGNGFCCPKEPIIHNQYPGQILPPILSIPRPPFIPPPVSYNCTIDYIKHGVKHLVKEHEISNDLITLKSVNVSLGSAKRFLKDIANKDKILMRKNYMVQKGTAASGHLRFTATSDKILEFSKLGDIFFETSRDLSIKFKLNKGQKLAGLRKYNASYLEPLSKYCPEEPHDCKQDRKYRSADGSCNNLMYGKGKLGQSLTPLMRLLPPSYFDGEWEPRVSASCLPLPSARLLSQAFIKDMDVPNNKYSLFVMQFGQFLDHDFTSVPIYRFNNQSGIRCCVNGTRLEKKDLHEHCMPIEIPVNDPFYSPHGQRCMNFVRSRLAPRIDCSLGYADQMNALTHWLDASNVYGSDLDEANELRLEKDGFLRYSKVAGDRLLLPLRDTSGDGCTDPEAGKFCFRAGDFRVNEMLGLVVTHLVWFREHNRIAAELKKMNTECSDEILYQESRRILIAEYQHIIYSEWLPIIIGESYMKSNDIYPLEDGYFEEYDPEIDPSIANEFSSAAFRMGHTLVQGIVNLFNRLGENNHKSVISENTNNPHGIRAPGRVDDWIRGLTRHPIQSFDNHITVHLNGRLFQPKGMKFGFDLSSLNIQRGRDHGIQGYNSYREFCGRGRATTFDDFNDVIPKKAIELLKIYYSHVDDVDLWIGGINERPEAGKLIGPTFACIIGDQFVRSKKGDRYFYDTDHEHVRFSEEQLVQIRRATFARILCDNGDNIKEMQPHAFLIPDDDENAIVDCRDDDISKVDLSPWKKIKRCKPA